VGSLNSASHSWLPGRLKAVAGRLRIDTSLESIYALADLIRRTEEELLRLFSAGMVSGTTHTCLGQELCQLAVVRALTDADFVFSNHRNHGHLLAYCGDVKGLIAEVTGREGGLCGGRGGSQHMAVGNFCSNGIQGGLTGVAVGCALGQRLFGSSSVAAVFIGDGTLGEGLVYEAMNLAGIWSLPVLFVVENNAIAQTTPSSWTISGSIAARGGAFGLTVGEFDDASESFVDDVAQFVTGIREGRRPGFLVINTARLGAHSKGDDLRPRVHIDEIRARDPLQALRRRISPVLVREIEFANEAFVRDASAEVLERGPSVPELNHIQSPENLLWPAGFVDDGMGRVWTVRESLNDTLRRLLKRDRRVVLLGEDLHDPYGGAFKVTAGLSSEFPGRVFSTPISEAGITGTAIGLSMTGCLPVLEIMFADFVGMCVDQLYNQATKLGRIHNGVKGMAMVIRTPVGGYRGYGPTHSQSPEALIASIPGMTVVSPNKRVSPGTLLENAILHVPGPLLFAEHKLLYGQRVELGDYVLLPPVGGHALEAAFPTAARLMDHADIVIITYGWILSLVEDAVRHLEDEEELSVEILVPTLLAPLPIDTLAERVRRCERLLIVEEGPRRMGIGSEIVSRLAEREVLAKVRLLGSDDGFIPAARHLEEASLPSVESIIVAATLLFK
jgi:2-oxoisovalerate dehydrogenase E1 component